MLPGDSHPLLNSGVPVLLKVNLARRKEKDLIMQLFATWSYRGPFAYCKEGCISIYPDRIRLPAVTRIFGM